MLKAYVFVNPIRQCNVCSLLRCRELQAVSDSKATELQSNLKLKQFELDRMQILYEETSQSLKQSNVDTAKYQHKLEVYFSLFSTFCFSLVVNAAYCIVV